MNSRNRDHRDGKTMNQDSKKVRVRVPPAVEDMLWHWACSTTPKIGWCLVCDQPMSFDGMPDTALADARNTARVHAAVIRRMRREPEPQLVPACEPETTKYMSPCGEQLRRVLEV